MAAHIQKTVFISYRRSNFPWAYCIYQNLTQHGFDVFFDYQSIDSGQFERVILDNIKARAHFIVILTPSALERCNEPGDWLRREIETAIDEGRNIIPIMLESFDFGSPLVKQSLTGKLASLCRYNGMSLVPEYAEEGLERLRNRFLNVTLEDIQLHALTEHAKEITERQKAVALLARPVETRELTAQVWLERGYMNASNGDIDEAIRCFTESVKRYPNYEAYYNRGIARRQKGELDGAIHDYNQAIGLYPGEAQTYNNRGNARRDKGDLEGALSDYNQAILRKPNAALAYINRGIIRTIQGDIDGALDDFEAVIKCRTTSYERAESFYRRGRLLELRDNLKGASKEYETAILIESAHVMAWASLTVVSQKLARNAEAEIQWKVTRRLMAEEPDYNQACAESILGNNGQAWNHLIIALGGKQVTREWARIDPDFENARGDTRFKDLLSEEIAFP